MDSIHPIVLEIPLVYIYAILILIGCFNIFGAFCILDISTILAFLNIFKLPWFISMGVLFFFPILDSFYIVGLYPNFYHHSLIFFILLVDEKLKNMVNNIAEIIIFIYSDISSISDLLEGIPRINNEFGEKYARFSNPVSFRT